MSKIPQQLLCIMLYRCWALAPFSQTNCSSSPSPAEDVQGTYALNSHCLGGKSATAANSLQLVGSVHQTQNVYAQWRLGREAALPNSPGTRSKEALLGEGSASEESSLGNHCHCWPNTETVLCFSGSVPKHIKHGHGINHGSWTDLIVAFKT